MRVSGQRGYAELASASVSRVRDRDLRSLFIGYAVSSAGSGLGAGALPIVAVLALHSSAFQVSLLSGLSGLAADTLMLLCAGVFGPVFTTYQMNVTADAYMARVRTAWGISSKTVQPLCVLAGGGLAAVAGVRTTLFVGGLVCTASVLLMPCRAISHNAVA
jgi:hypothetical protein